MTSQSLSILMFLPYYKSNSKIQCSTLSAPGFKEVSRASSKFLKFGSPKDRSGFAKSSIDYSEEDGSLLCYNEPSETLDKKKIRIRLPLSLFLALFRMGQYKQLRGHIGASRTYANYESFYFWPGMFDWI